MKNIFKLMGVALMACTLLVACNKDNDENDTTPAEPTEGVKVTFGTDSWWAADIIGNAQYASQGYLQMGSFKDYDDANAPYCQGMVPALVYTATHVHNEDYFYQFYYENENDVTDGSLIGGEAGSSYPNWQPNDGMVSDVTAIDLTAQTLTGTVTGSCFYLPDYINDVETIKDLKVEFINAKWETK